MSPASPRPPLARSELEIARLVWKLGEATVRQVYEALPAERQLDFWTVQTYLRRLKAKGYLESERKGQTNVYRSAVRPRIVIHEVLSDLVERLFDGDMLPLFQHLIEERGLADKEIDQLQAYLNRLKANRK